VEEYSRQSETKMRVSESTLVMQRAAVSARVLSVSAIVAVRYMLFLVAL
jgi:hypothetical protein